MKCRNAAHRNHRGNRYGDSIQEKNEASQLVQKVAGGRGWVRVWTSLSCKVGEYHCLLKFKAHAICLKPPVGTKRLVFTISGGFTPPCINDTGIPPPYVFTL